MSKRTPAESKPIAHQDAAQAWELIQQITDDPADDGRDVEDTNAIIEILEAIDGGE